MLLLRELGTHEGLLYLLLSLILQLLWRLDWLLLLLLFLFGLLLLFWFVFLGWGWWLQVVGLHLRFCRDVEVGDIVAKLSPAEGLLLLA